MSALYNVGAVVVALVHADSEADALADMKARLRAAGFEPYEPTDAEWVFESEPPVDPCSEGCDHFFAGTGRMTHGCRDLRQRTITAQRQGHQRWESGTTGL
jgi:hypothetical protein